MPSNREARKKALLAAKQRLVRRKYRRESLRTFYRCIGCGALKPKHRDDLNPQKPTNNLLHVENHDTLIAGFARNIDNMEFEKFPSDLIHFCAKWIFISDGITYQKALDVLLNKDKCFGLYDFKLLKWRPVVYVTHSNDTISVTCIDDKEHKKGCNAAKCFMIQDLPVNYIWINPNRFNASKDILKKYSGLDITNRS